MPDQQSPDEPEAQQRPDDSTSRLPSRPDPTTMRFRGFVEGDIVDLEHRLSSEDQATIGALRPGTALLVVLKGPNLGARFLLDDDEVTSGRHPDSDIFLDDVTVSRRHAIFVREGEGYTVKDVGSLNGTYVNRTSTDSAALVNGDEVQIGKYRFVYYTG